LLVIDIDFLIYTKKRGLHTIRSLTAFGLQLPLLMNEQSQTPRIDMIIWAAQCNIQWCSSY